MNKLQLEFTQKIKQTYKRYLNSQKVSSLVNKKLTFENRIIKKEFSPVPKNMRQVAFRETIVSGQSLQKHPQNREEVEQIRTFESLKTSVITCENKAALLFKLSPVRRSQSAHNRLSLLKKKSKGDSPDKLFATLSVYFSKKGDHVRSNSQGVSRMAKLKVHGESPVPRRHSYQIQL